MTEQYKDTYQNKYREETAQIHAPLSLIEKTKAAVREEEKRLAQTAVLSGKERRAFSVRKWAYPLTAAAAILILASVSLTMRGLKSADMSEAPSAVYDGAAESGAAYEASVESADAGYEETAMEAPAAEAPAAEDSMLEEMLEEAAAEDVTTDMTEGTTGAGGLSAAQNAGSAGSAGAGQTNGLSQEDVMADMAVPAEEKLAEESDVKSEREMADRISQKGAADAQKQEAVSEQQRGNADQDDFTIEKVTRCPVRFNGSDVKIHRYEGKVFRVLEADFAGNNLQKAWEAYVEESAGEGYVICGEAESVEDFLAVAYRKLGEEK